MYAVMQIACQGISLPEPHISMERFATIAEAKAFVEKTNSYYNFDIRPDYLVIVV